jgi:hypothetical protein
LKFGYNWLRRANSKSSPRRTWVDALVVIRP